MLGLLSRKESKFILKTASDDADTLSLAHESNASISLRDDESVTTSKLDGREFDFDFEVINTAAYRKVFHKARSKLSRKKGSAVYSPPHAPTSSGASAPETVGLSSINAHAVIPSVVASQESEPSSSRPNASSRDIRSHSVLPKDSAEAAEAADDGTGRMREEDHDADSENQPELTSKESEVRIGGYSVSTTIGTGRRGKVKLAWKKDHVFAVKFIRREPDALGTDLPRNPSHRFAILRGLSHPNIIRLHDILETDSHSAVVLDYIPGGSLVEYVNVKTYLTEHVSQRLFAQIISAVGYLHRKGIVNSTLSCSKVLLDINQNATLTGFSNVKAFDVKESPRMIMSNFTEEIYCSDGEESPRFDGAREADVRSCGIILVSAQYGLVLDINEVKYFMLAGHLHSAALFKPPGYDAQWQLNSSSCTPMTFPEYFPFRVQELVRRMLAERFPARATLRDVAQHSWLSDYAHIVKDIIEKPIVSSSPWGPYH